MEPPRMNATDVKMTTAQSTERSDAQTETDRAVGNAGGRKP